MSYMIIRPASHDEWLQERLKGIGSSDAGTIMGASPFSTPLRLWRQRKGLIPPVEENEAMRFGHAFEPTVAEYIAAKIGGTIDYASEGDWMAVDCDRPYLRVSPDRLFWPEGVEQTSDNWWIMEVKTTSKAVDRDNPPLYWYCQVQYQMGVMGIRNAVIAYLTASPRLECDYIVVEFNPAFYATLVSLIDSFWHTNILGDVEPEAVDSHDATLRYPTHADGVTREVSSETLRACHELAELKNRKKEIETAIASAEAAIRLEAKDAESLVYTDRQTGEQRTAATYRSVNETVLDEERLKTEQPQVYRQYVQEVFDRTRFTQEMRQSMKEYFGTRKGSRRLTVKTIPEEVLQALTETAGQAA